MLADRFFEIKQRAKHLWKASGPHGVHSPFVYDLITKILIRKKAHPVFVSIEKERKKLKRNSSLIVVDDFGAGSRALKKRERSIARIANAALQSPHCAQALFKLVKESRSEKILELGTSLGITASYLAFTNPKAKVWTLEGAPAVAKHAESIFKTLELKNVECVVGPFSEQLPSVLNEMERVDFALMDGHHLYEPTMQYFAQIAAHCHPESIVVLDDIHWSPGMEKAWDEIRSKNEISLSLDFFHFGVLFFRKRPQKEHFILRLP